MRSSSSAQRKRRLTPKQRVLNRWPDSYAERMGNGWYIYTLSKPNRIEVQIGNGLTPADAWADAARNL